MPEGAPVDSRRTLTAPLTPALPPFVLLPFAPLPFEAGCGGFVAPLPLPFVPTRGIVAAGSSVAAGVCEGFTSCGACFAGR